ncbi:MAG TPA: bifunctional (p)ppGpp synthetase/guanosine-3',5'-bis(diphosphate) 3'-pyrophosphohydrolase [Clostridia bacterium]|nr:bifunctional (p)ppGpp synthetase/guanosine-3',5'-bis(diphosphate) 3'-pyrophosphohydrolase [Clostridia bacterium]
MDEKIIEKVTRNYSESDRQLFEKACAFARDAHKGQKRESGEPYINHPYNVAEILIDLGMDMHTVAAGLLHDVIEDTEYDADFIKENFGLEIETLISGVTKISKLQFTTREERQAKNLRNMLLAMAKDIRIIIIKLADRLHNMRTLQYCDISKQKAISRETIEIFAPLANRLGMFNIKSELEDLAFKYLHTEAYNNLASNVELLKKQREDFIEQMIAILRPKLAENNIDAVIYGRPKHYYSIYKKMTVKNRTLDQIYDLIAIRVIVNTIRECYETLGIVHTIWRPLPGRFKDYIAMPKANMYQSLHTTVFGANSTPFEIQIRTHEMHITAELGIAAHWKYKEGITANQLNFEEKLSWLRRVLEWQSEYKDSKEFVDSLKIDVFSDEVFVFSPKGDIINLPIGSTPLDYAYAIHSMIGHKCIGARINNKIVPLSTSLKSGDIVEIITTSAPHGPSRDWLNIVKTSQAKSKIRQWFKKEMREENIEKGRDTLEREAKRLGYQLSQLTRTEWLEPIFEKYTLNSLDDLYAAIGYGGISAGQILPRLAEEYKKVNNIEREPVKQPKGTKTPKDSTQGVRVKGHSNMLVRFARCCNPVPGDKIIGYITRGRGVSIHRQDCVNIAGFEPEREIEVEWEEARGASYSAEIQITAYDHVGLFMLITNQLVEREVNILAVNAHTNKNSIATINFTIEITDTDQLNKVISQLKRIPNIIDVTRVTVGGNKQ